VSACYGLQWSGCGNREGLPQDALLVHTPHSPPPYGYHAPATSNTPSEYPNSTPTQYSTSYPTQTELPPYPVPCSTDTPVPILPPQPVPHLVHHPRRHLFHQPSPHASSNELPLSVSHICCPWPPFSAPLITDPHTACTPVQYPCPNAEDEPPHNTYHHAAPIPTPRPTPSHVVHSPANHTSTAHPSQNKT